MKIRGMNPPRPSTSVPETTSAVADDLSASPTGAVPASPSEPATGPGRNYTKLGLGLMLFSGVLWAPLPVLPFLSIPASVKVAVGTVLFIGVQIAWWGGTVLAGPAAVRKVYAFFRQLQWWKQPEPDDADQLPKAP